MSSRRSRPVDQPLSDPYDPPPPPEWLPPPVTIHLTADHVWIGRFIEEGATLLRANGVLWERVDAQLAADRARWPCQVEVVIVTDDGVPYRDMITALDLARSHGYRQPLLGGGPPNGR